MSAIRADPGDIALYDAAGASCRVWPQRLVLTMIAKPTVNPIVLVQDTAGHPVVQVCKMVADTTPGPSTHSTVPAVDVPG
jgi:hypothetical protein